MTEPLFITENEFLIRIKAWDPYRIIYFINSIFHVIKEHQLTEITEAEAGECLKNGFELWKIEEGEVHFKNIVFYQKDNSQTIIKTNCHPKEFLCKLFNTEFYQRVAGMTNYFFLS